MACQQNVSCQGLGIRGAIPGSGWPGWSFVHTLGWLWLRRCSPQLSSWPPGQKALTRVGRFLAPSRLPSPVSGATVGADSLEILPFPFRWEGSAFQQSQGLEPWPPSVDKLDLVQSQNHSLQKRVIWRSCVELYSWDRLQRKSFQGLDTMG